MSKRSTMNMTEGTIWKQLVLFALPLIASNLFQQLYNSVDAVIVGNFCGSASLAAVGSTTHLINLVFYILFGISNGCSVVISQLYGGKDSDGVSNAVHTAYGIAILGGLLITLVGTLVSRPLLTLMQSPADTINLAHRYLRIYFMGSLFILIYNTGAAALRAVGDSKHPFYYLLTGSITNIVLDLLFIGVFKMGVSGAALATVFSQALSAALVTLRLLRTQDIYRLCPKKIRIHRYLIGKILRIGVPNGLMGMMYSVPNMTVQAKVNMFGSLVMAGCTSFSKIESFIYMALSALSTAVATFIGQNIGARRMDRVKRGTRVCLLMGFCMTFCLISSVMLFHKPLLGLFTSDSEVIRYGSIAMFTMLPGYLLFTVIELLSGVLRGAGNTFAPMVILAICICLVRVVYLSIVIPFFPSLVAVYLCYPISWIIACTVLTLYYLKGKWRPAE